jgi:hypothetical protein
MCFDLFFNMVLNIIKSETLYIYIFEMSLQL